MDRNIIYALSAASLLAFSANTASAAVININDGAKYDLSAADVPPPSAYNSNDIISSNPVVSYASLDWYNGSVSYGSLQGSGGFISFYFDGQEPKASSKKSLTVLDIVIKSGSTLVFDYDEATHGSISFADVNANRTDLSLYIPTSLFDSHSFASTDLIDFLWRQADDDGSPDEWTSYAKTPAVPLPATGLLLVGAIGMAGAFRRRRAR